jgi:hypothetical protein
MKGPLTKRLKLAWLLLVAIASGATVVVWLVATGGSPPPNAVLIERAEVGSTDRLSLAQPQATPGQRRTPDQGAVIGGQSSKGSSSQTLIPDTSSATPITGLCNADERRGVHNIGSVPSQPKCDRMGERSAKCEV